MEKIDKVSTTLRDGEESIHQKFASDILGKNFFGVEEWNVFYGVNFAKKQLKEIADFPWNESVLNAPCPFVDGKIIKETHFAFLGLDFINNKPLTILKWQELHSELDQPHFYSYSPSNWYPKEIFATKLTCKFHWYLMPLKVIQNSIDKTSQKQVAILPSEYEIPLVIEEVTKDILYYRKNTIYLNTRRWGRCQDVTSEGYPVSVGDFGPYGLGVSDYWGDARHCEFGLAASRKF